MLNDLITTNQIQIHQRVESWMDAIRVAASPLLLEKKIQPAYIETMVQNVESHGPYIVLMPDVAIPHARPEDGSTATRNEYFEIRRTCFISAR